MSFVIQSVAGELTKNARGNYRVQISAPSAMRPRDQLVVVLGSDANVLAESNVDWDFDDQQVTADYMLRILRREVTNAEPLAYTFDGNDASTIFLGGSIVYRMIAASSLVDFDAVDRSAVSNALMPVSTRSRASDVHLGVLYEDNNAAAVPEPNVNASSALARKRFSAVWNDAGTIKRRLHVYDAIGAAGIGSMSHQIALTAAIAHVAVASITLPGLPEQGARQIFAPIAMGAIGLPVKGI